MQANRAIKTECWYKIFYGSIKLLNFIMSVCVNLKTQISKLCSSCRVTFTLDHFFFFLFKELVKVITPIDEMLIKSHIRNVSILI